MTLLLDKLQKANHLATRHKVVNKLIILLIKLINLQSKNKKIRILSKVCLLLNHNNYKSYIIL